MEDRIKINTFFVCEMDSSFNLSIPTILNNTHTIFKNSEVLIKILQYFKQLPQLSSGMWMPGWNKYTYRNTSCISKRIQFSEGVKQMCKPGTDFLTSSWSDWGNDSTGLFFAPRCWQEGQPSASSLQNRSPLAQTCYNRLWAPAGARTSTNACKGVLPSK